MYLVADSDALKEMTRMLGQLSQRGVRCQLRVPAPYKDLAEAPPEKRAVIIGGTA